MLCRTIDVHPSSSSSTPVVRSYQGLPTRLSPCVSQPLSPARKRKLAETKQAPEHDSGYLRRLHAGGHFPRFRSRPSSPLPSPLSPLASLPADPRRQPRPLSFQLIDLASRPYDPESAGPSSNSSPVCSFFHLPLLPLPQLSSWHLACLGYFARISRS